MAREAKVIIAAWGNNGALLGRNTEVEKVFELLYCLKVTSKGHPCHPLYLPKNSEMHLYKQSSKGTLPLFRVRDPYEMFSSMGRIAVLIADFKNQFGNWPKKLLISEGELEEIQKYLLTTAGMEKLNESLKIVPIREEGIYLCMDDELNSLAYSGDRETLGDTHAGDAIAWLGMKV